MFEYRNDFLYIILKSSQENQVIYCSGVNITRFLPLTKGRHRLGQNPVEKGLQSVNNEVKSLLLSYGATIKTARGNPCSGIISPRDELWYTESFIINDISYIPVREVVSFAILNLIKKIFLAMMLDERPLENLPSPEELQRYFIDLCRKTSNL